MIIAGIEAIAPFDQDHDDPPEWNVDVANGHQICDAVWSWNCPL